MIVVAPAVVAQLPSGPGVYRFRDEGGSVLYIGRATDLRRRVRSYWTARGDRPWLARMVPRVTRVEVAVCDSTHEAAWLERNLLERRRPPWNNAVGGNEVPVAIRVDDRRRDAGLSVVHLPHALGRRPLLRSLPRRNQGAHGGRRPRTTARRLPTRSRGSTAPAGIWLGCSAWTRTTGKPW